MKKPIKGFAFGDQEAPIANYHIWAAIQYLDSATNYREYLPKTTRRDEKARQNSLILLDDSTRPILASSFRYVCFMSFVVFLLALLVWMAHGGL